MTSLYAKILVPWPVRNSRRGPSGKIELTGFVSSSQGSIFGVCAVPVIERSGHYVPADSTGAPSALSRVGHYFFPQLDADGGFRLALDAALWNGVEGILMSVIYFGKLGDELFSDRPLLRPKRFELPSLEPIPLRVFDDLPPTDQERIEEALAPLLAEPASRLEPGLFRRPS